MLIKIGRFRFIATRLPRIPTDSPDPHFIRLQQRIAERRAAHQATSRLERQLALAKFGVKQ